MKGGGAQENDEGCIGRRDQRMSELLRRGSAQSPIQLFLPTWVTKYVAESGLVAFIT
jgi:hypothetical protein